MPPKRLLAKVSGIRWHDSDVGDLKLIVGDRISILVTFFNVGARGQCTRIQLWWGWILLANHLLANTLKPHPHQANARLFSMKMIHFEVVFFAIDFNQHLSIRSPFNDAPNAHFKPIYSWSNIIMINMNLINHPWIITSRYFRSLTHRVASLNCT